MSMAWNGFGLLLVVVILAALLGTRECVQRWRDSRRNK